MENKRRYVVTGRCRAARSWWWWYLVEKAVRYGRGCDRLAHRHDASIAHSITISLQAMAHDPYARSERPMPSAIASPWPAPERQQGRWREQPLRFGQPGPLFVQARRPVDDDGRKRDAARSPSRVRGENGHCCHGCGHGRNNERNAPLLPHRYCTTRVATGH